jgi:hypothetical protein
MRRPKINFKALNRPLQRDLFYPYPNIYLAS